MSGCDDASRYLERQRQTASIVVSAQQAPHRRALKEGEWACVDAKCAYINSDRRTVCERCGKGKPRSKNRAGREIGKDAAEKSKGLFAAEDWACTKCGNVNWARRTTCNICNAPKLGDLEVRTGYGGGYMDRQNVEYIERKDDDEFDEFGRKKKRKKLDDGRDREDETIKEDEKRNKDEEESGEIDHDSDADMSKQFCDKEEIEQQEKDEDEEEDEDEGSDDDLDKYDLSVDDFEVEDLKAKIAARKAALAQTTAASPDSRCSSECSCSCSGGDCSCEDSETEEEQKRTLKEKDKDKNVLESRENRDRTRPRDHDERDHKSEHKSRSRERSPRRIHSSSYRDKDRR